MRHTFLLSRQVKINMGGISNWFIHSVLDPLPLTLWDGVYSCDRIPGQLWTKNFAIIVNFSNYEQVGTHFIVLTQLGGKLFLLDSLALPAELIPSGLKTLMDEKGGIYVFRGSPIQQHLSKYCGFYCIYFILYLNISGFEPTQVFNNAVSYTHLTLPTTPYV